MITLAEEAARRAGEVLRENFGKASLQVSRKAGSDYVTDVDRRSEEVIRELLQGELPDHSFLLEEGGAVGPRSDYQWVIDPLDGTTNYIHRYPFFSVSVALAHRGQVILGVVYDPVRREMFTAERGEPARLNGVPLTVSRAAQLGDALVSTGFPFRVREAVDPYLACFKRILLAASDLRRDGSAALDLAYVAAGRYEAFWELGLQPWDMAAGSLLIECAGGRVSDFHGGDGYLAGGDIVASNSLLHEPLLDATRASFPVRPARPGPA